MKNKIKVSDSNVNEIYRLIKSNRKIYSFYCTVKSKYSYDDIVQDAMYFILKYMNISEDGNFDKFINRLLYCFVNNGYKFIKHRPIYQEITYGKDVDDSDFDGSKSYIKSFEDVLNIYGINPHTDILEARLRICEIEKKVFKTKNKKLITYWSIIKREPWSTLRKIADEMGISLGNAHSLKRKIKLCVA